MYDVELFPCFLFHEIICIPSWLKNHFPDIDLFLPLVFLKCRECCHPFAAVKKNINTFLNCAMKIDITGSKGRILLRLIRDNHDFGEFGGEYAGFKSYSKVINLC